MIAIKCIRLKPKWKHFDFITKITKNKQIVIDIMSLIMTKYFNINYCETPENFLLKCDILS